MRGPPYAAGPDRGGPALGLSELVEGYRIGSMEFQPLDSGTTYADLAFGPSSGGPTPVARFTTVGGSLVAVPHLPGGALLTGAELDFCDSNPDQHVHLFVDTASSDGTGLTAIGSISSSNVNGCGKVFLDLTAANYTINNNSKELIFLVFFDAFDGTNALSGVIVHYQLQVSPAPARAPRVRPRSSARHIAAYPMASRRALVAPSVN